MNFVKLLIPSFALLLVSACNQQQSSPDENVISNIPDTSVSQQDEGFHVSGVASKGPIQNATVEIYAVDNTGVPTGVALATATTDVNGQWQVSFATAPTEATLIVVSGGSYIDEADPAPSNKRKITLAPTDTLKGVLFPGFTSASVTILTNALLDKCVTETTSNNFQDVLNNNRNTAKLALGFDPFTVAAANPLSPSTSDSVDSIEYAMYLGGVATALNSAAIILGQPVPDYEIMMGMVKDMSDGLLNGKYQGASFQVSVNGVNTDFPSNIDLNLAIQRFRNNNYAAYSVTEVQDIVTVNEAVLAVPGTNVAPTAVDDSATTVSGVTINLSNVLANDIDADADQLVVASFTQPSNGTVTENASGGLSFAPASGFTGNTVFTYIASDNRGGQDTAQVVITVIAAPVVTNPTPTTPGVPPTADAGQDQTVNEDSAVSIAGTGVDSDGNAVSDFLWEQVSGTTATLSGATTSNLSFTSPTITQVDVMVFTLTTTDSDGLIGIDTVSVIILPVNTSPTAEAGAVQTVSELSDVSLTGSGTDADSNDSITFQWSQISGGTTISLTGGDTATATFTAPDIPTTETYVFALTVTDNEGAVAIDTVNIVITALNDIPVADAGVDQSADEQTPITLTGTASDTDGTITSFEWSLVSDSPSVTLTDANTDTVSFTTPVVLINTVDVLVLQLLVTDNAGAIHTDYVTVIVNPVLVDPVANAGTDQTVDELLQVTLNGSGTDEGSVITDFSWSQVSPVSPIAILSDTAISNPVFTGPDIANDTTFTFALTVTDTEGGTHTDNVDINLVSLNSGPSTVDDIGAVTDEDSSLLISDLLTNDSDPESDAFTINAVTQATNGTVVIEAGNTEVTYTPALNFNGTDTFTYTAIDEFGAISVTPATVTVTVNGVNDDPVAIDDSMSTVQGIPVTLTNATANDTDLEDNTLLISGITQATFGSVVNNGDGTITYTPDLDNADPDSFDYTIVDGFGGSATATVNITITADSDLDAIPDTQEAIDGTDPDLADTDGDGFFDNHEKIAGTSALLNTEMPPGTSISATETVPNNIISSDTTWTLANSPYWVKSDVSINSGITLTIEAGVVIKSNSGVDFFVNGGLVTQGNIPQPQNVVFTASSDDSINGDTDGVVLTPGEGAWNGIDFNQNSQGNILNTDISYANQCVYVYNASLILDRMDIGDCSSYGIYGYTTTSGTHTINLSNINILDIDANGRSTGSHGLYFYSGGNGTLDLNIDNIVTSNNGNSVSEFGLYLYSYYGHISGSINDLTVNNSSGEAVYIYNAATFNIDSAFNNLTISSPGDDAVYVNNNSTGATTPSFDGIVTISGVPTNRTNMYFINSEPDFLSTVDVTLDGAAYGLYLRNSDGNIRNITINNSTLAGVKLASASNPAVFSNVVLTNASSPYELEGQNLSQTIIDGYDYSDPSVTRKFIRLTGTLLEDMTLTPDPIGTDSVWYIPSNVTVNAGITLAINDGAVVKFAASTYLYITGNLTIGDPDGLGDGAGIGTKAVLTSILDDSVDAGGDSNGDGTATTPARNNWGYIDLRTGSNLAIDNATIRYMNRAVYQSSSYNPASVTIMNTDITEFYEYGLDFNPGSDITYTLNTLNISNGGRNDGIHIANNIYVGAPLTVTIDFDDIVVDTIGDSNTYDRGIEIYFESYYGHAIGLTGRMDNITVNNTQGDNILIQNITAGIVDPVLSGLTLSNALNNRYGLHLVGLGDGNTRPTVDDSFDTGNVTNLIGNATAGSGGYYGLVVNGVNGSYSHITIDNTTMASLFISNGTDPLSWDDSTINISNSPSPWSIHTIFPASIGVLGTADLGYTAGSGLTTTYAKVNGILTDTTLVADPLNTGSSVWRVPSSITIPTGTTLTIEDGAIVKFDAAFSMIVEGSLIVGDPDGLGDGAGIGAKTVFTSIYDDSVGGDTNGDDVATSPGQNNWNYIELRNGSSIAMDNAIIRYMNRGVYQAASYSPASVSIMNTEISDFYEYGLDFLPPSSISYTLDTLYIHDGGRNDGIHIASYYYTNAPIDITLDFDDIVIDTIGDGGAGDRGIEIYFDSYYSQPFGLTGRMDNITVSNTSGDNILIQNITAGIVDPVLSGLTLSNPLNNRYGLYLIGLGDGNTSPTVDDSFNPGNVTNFIGNATVGSGGFYGMLVSGVNGSYSHISIDNTTAASLYISNFSDPTVWDDATINISNSPSPWSIHTTFPTSIGIFGTDDLGYTAGTGLSTDYVKVNGTITTTTLVPDPLNTFGTTGVNSVWRVPSNLTISALNTLTINDGAILKFDAAFSMIVEGSLIVGDPDGLGDGAGIGAKTVFTSIYDDSVGGDTNGDDVATSPGQNNWNYIELRNGSSIAMDNAIIRYMNRGVYQAASYSPASVSIMNTEISDFYEYGLDFLPPSSISYTLDTLYIHDGGRNDGIHIASYYYTNAPIDITLDFDDIVIDTIGDGGAGDRGIEIYFDSYYSQPFGLTGRMDNITVSNTSGDNILIQNITAGIVDPILSGLTLTNPLNDRYGLYIIGAGDGNTRPTIDDSFDPGVATNLIGDVTAGSGGRWGLLISGADGTYSDITISNTTQASMYFSGNSSPTFGNNITLVDSPSPYTLAGMSLPAGISYTEGAGLSNLYVNTYGTFTNDATLSADPLGTGTSVWYVDNDITINAGATLTIDAGAVLKAVDNVDIFVDGTLDVDPINAGGNVVITDFRDDNYNGDSNNNGVSTGSNTANWQGIDFRIGSLGTVNNLIVEFAEVGVHVQDAGDTGGLNFTNLEINNSVDGLYVYQTSTTISTAPTFDGLSINECSSEHIYLRATNTTTGALMQPIFSGDLSITDVIGSYAPNGIYNIYVGSYVVLSGFTITGTQEAVDLHTGTSLTLENNIIRQATNMGINARSAAAPVIQNNIIVNNGITGANDSGIYANTGTNAFINNNIIRQNRGDYGAGIMVRASSPVIQNNLIIENEDIQNDIYGGSGIFVWDNSAPSILNNTIANNISATTTQGGGIHIDSSSSGQVTMLDNIIYGNLDGNSTAKDVYLNGSVTLVESNNLIGVHNLATPDATDIIAVDPQFTDGWYLANQNVFPLGPIDAGSVLAGETALGNGVVIMSATTTRTDGVNEGAASMIDMGYHYPDTTAAPTISAANTTVTPASHIETPNTGGTVVTITLTPKDSGDFDLGAGLDVSVAVGALEADFLSSVKDLGDGTYQVTYTIPVGSSSANVSFNVNGVDITATTDISWTL